MDKSESKHDGPKKERRLDPKLLKKGLRCDQDQYDMLKRCSDKKDMTEWNEWREDHPDDKVLLAGARLQRANLQGADFHEGNLQGAKLQGANLRGAKFWSANLENAKLALACLQDADLERANLKHAVLWKADLKYANLTDARLQGTVLSMADLKGAKLETVVVDGETVAWMPNIDRKTDFSGVGLASLRIHPQTKQLLEYNIRRRNWEMWYEWKDWYEYEPERERSKLSQFFLKRTIGWFWSISDYGRSTGKIIAWFFGLAIAFGAVYRLCATCVIVNGVVGDIRGFWHAFYFSVVTMTTLGFGDIAANPDSWWGQTLLMAQVILGYVLLGALVTRFAVLFTAGGPAGRFAVRERNKSCPKPKVGWDELARDKGILQTGDVIHVQSRGIISKLVRFFSRAWKEEPSWASHSAMVLRVGEEIEIIEALWRTLIRPITAYEGKRSKLLVCRKPGGIEEEQKQKMIEKAEYYEGKPYGFWEITFHVLDRLLNNSYVFRRLIKDNDYPICSWLVAYVYDRILGYHFGAPPNAAQPDDLLDHCTDYDWEFIWADSSKSVADFCRTYKLPDKDDFEERT